MGYSKDEFAVTLDNVRRPGVDSIVMVRVPASAHIRHDGRPPLWTSILVVETTLALSHSTPQGAMGLKGELDTFTTPDGLLYPYFTSGDLSSRRALVFIGGLTNGLGGVPYLPKLSAALGNAGWKLYVLVLSLLRISSPLQGYPVISPYTPRLHASLTDSVPANLAVCSYTGRPRTMALAPRRSTRM